MPRHASSGTSRRSEGHAHRHHPRVDAGAPRREGRPCRSRTAAAAEIKAVLGEKLGATLVEFDRSAVGARPRPRADEPGFPRRSGAAGAGVHARPAVPPRAATARRCSRNSPPRSGRPSSCPGKVFGSGDDGADRLPGRTGRRPHRAAGQSRHRHDPGAGAGDELPLPHPAIPDAPGGRLGGARLYRDPDRFRGAQRALEILGR